MGKNYQLILITGVPSSGKSTICKTFANFGDECNVIDADLYGEWIYDSVAEDANWLVNINDLKLAIRDFSDKPTIVVGVCDNMTELMKLFKDYRIYVIEHDSEKIAKRLNIRYDKLNQKEKVFSQVVYGIKYHNAGSVDKTFSELMKEIWQHKQIYSIIKLSIMGVIADVASLLEQSKENKL